jgi:hypothetical protein
LLRISIPWIFDVLAELNKAAGIKAEKDPFLARTSLHAINQKIEALFNESVYRPFLRTSYSDANDLNIKLREIIYTDDIHSNLDERDKLSAIWLVERFKTIFIAELATLPIMLAMPKGGYDVAVLLERGWEIFPQELSNKVPEALKDANEAAKALAFELGTACGFHTFRVLEAVLKRYWDAVAGKKRPNLETIGSFARAMTDDGIGDPKVRETLKQVASLHRNPIIHPEVILTVEEAIGIIGISRSVISAMLAVLPEQNPTTTSPPVG